MFIITFHHFDDFISSNGNPKDAPALNQWLNEWGSFGQMGVIMFVAIGGFFLNSYNFEMKKVRRIWGPTLFYSVSLMLIFLIIQSIWGTGCFGAAGVAVTPSNAVRAFFPVVFNQYWYVTIFVAVLFILPALKQQLEKMDKGQIEQLIIVALLFELGIIFYVATTNFSRYISNSTDEGYLKISNLVAFATVYTIGYYLQTYQNELIKQKVVRWSCLLGTIVTYFAFTQIIDLLKANSATPAYIPPFLRFLIMDVNSPILQIFGISLFIFFANVQIRSAQCQAIIAKMGTLTFAVYLIHTNNFLKPTIYKTLLPNTPLYYDQWWFIFYAFFATCVIFFSCLLIEYLRQIVSRKLFSRP
jgi:hypothetical protein